MITEVVHKIFDQRDKDSYDICFREKEISIPNEKIKNIKITDEVLIIKIKNEIETELIIDIYAIDFIRTYNKRSIKNDK